VVRPYSICEVDGIFVVHTTLTLEDVLDETVTDEMIGGLPTVTPTLGEVVRMEVVSRATATRA
jgi:hypothetical protein